MHGVSTRSVDDLVVALGADTGISKSEVSRICAPQHHQHDRRLIGYTITRDTIRTSASRPAGISGGPSGSAPAARRAASSVSSSLSVSAVARWRACRTADSAMMTACCLGPILPAAVISCSVCAASRSSSARRAASSARGERPRLKLKAPGEGSGYCTGTRRRPMRTRFPGHTFEKSTGPSDGALCPAVRDAPDHAPSGH